MPDRCLFRDLCRVRPPALRSVDLPTLVTQIGVPPDLRYFVDGLRRTKKCLERCAGELDICLRTVPGALEADALTEGIDALLVWGASQQWPADDPRLEPMQRVSSTARNPLSGDYLSVLFHWGNLFYSLEPGNDGSAGSAGGSATAGHDDPVRYEDLMAEFSGYVIATQARIDSGTYLEFCRSWCAHENLLSLLDNPIYPSGQLFSRVGSASRAARRLSLKEHRALFSWLTDPANGEALHQRVFAALGRSWRTGDQELIEHFARLLEKTRPGWRRPQPVRGFRAPARRASRASSQHRTFRDGYVRVPGQDVIRLDFITDEGIRVEHFQPMPEGLAILDEEGVGEDESGSAPAGSGPGEAGFDGSEWIPTGEQRTEGDIDALLLEPGLAGDKQPAALTARWAQDHLRRYQLALGITHMRLSQREVHRLLGELARVDVAAADKEALLALHACLSLGRPMEQIAGLEIHAGTARAGLDATRLHYFLGSRQWVVACPAPAWGKLRRERIERTQWPALWLNDHTAFFELLDRLGLALPGQPFQRITQNRRRAIGDFLGRALPRSEASLERCSGFLFHRLLQVTGGDLGIASLITGHSHAPSRSVAHYANYRPRQIWNAYEDAWRATHRTQSPHPETPGDSGGYGAKRVPTIEAVRALVQALAGWTRDVRASPCARHNAYTAYTVIGMVLGLAMRPVTDVLITEIGGAGDDALLASFVDKARSDYDRRVNPLPGRLIEHLCRYANYRTAIRVLPWTAGCASNFLYRDPDSGKASVFRPSHFGGIAGDAFPLELYALRRFVRSELQRTPGVEGEDVDACMGHWPFGASPFDPLSTYPPRRLRDFAAGPLDGLLGAVGFAPVP